MNNEQNSDTIYVGKKVSSYIANTKTLGDTTHKEKYDDFKANGVDVKPLGKGSLKGKAYEEGEYYKLCSGKTGAKRYNMNGDPKED